MEKKEEIDEVEYYKLKKLLEELKKCRGRHTVLVSYYIPAGYDLTLVINHLSQELHTAQNIKDKNTRKDVMAALEKIINELKRIGRTPPNGLVVFCGNIASAEGGFDLRIWLIEPPKPLNMRLYRCDDHFIVEPLEKLIEQSGTYGLLVLDNRHATFGLLDGQVIKVIKNMESLVPHETRKGGQSAQRFARVREAMRKDWYKEVADKLVEYFGNNPEIKGILIGGPGPVKEIFVEYIPPEIKKKIIAILPTCYTGEIGLRELVNRAVDYLQEERIAREKKVLNEFFYHLGKDTGLAVYGKEDVLRALEYGAAEKVLVSEDVPMEDIDMLHQKAKATGAEFYIISTKTEEGIQFKNLGGYGAILRFKLGMW